MGGTFDPVHYGHLFLAEEARVQCDLQHVVFIPNGQPAHAEGKEAQADPEARWELTRLATAANTHFSVSRVEVDRPGKSYLYDTLQHFQAEYGPETELYFIVGADSMRDLGTWYRSADLFRMCRFVAATRPGFDLENAVRLLPEEHRGRVVWLEVPGLHIASRDLRQRVRDGQAIRYLTPDEVVAGIEKHRLYGSQHTSEQVADSSTASAVLSPDGDMLGVSPRF
jgi:nicotinate-nucleotide adenylyltransferase